MLFVGPMPDATGIQAVLERDAQRRHSPDGHLYNLLDFCGSLSPESSGRKGKYSTSDNPFLVVARFHDALRDEVEIGEAEMVNEEHDCVESEEHEDIESEEHEDIEMTNHRPTDGNDAASERNADIQQDSGSSPFQPLTVQRFRKHWLDELPEELKPYLIVAGGSVHALVQRRGPEYFAHHDVDYFLIGDHGELVFEAVIQALADWMAAERNMRSAIRTPNSITFTTNGIRDGLGEWATEKTQVVLRQYDSISHVLHGFDLPCAAVALIPDQDVVLGTELAVFTYETNVMPVDPSRASPTYPLRLAKYLDRDVKLAFPNLDPLPVGEAFAKTHFRFLSPCEGNMPDSTFQQDDLHLNFTDFQLRLSHRTGAREYIGKMLVPRSRNMRLLAEIFGYDVKRKLLDNTNSVDQMNSYLLREAVRADAEIQPPLALKVPINHVGEAQDVAVYCPPDIRFDSTYALRIYRPKDSAWSASFSPTHQTPESWYGDFYNHAPGAAPVPLKWPAVDPPSMYRVLLHDMRNVPRLYFARRGEDYHDIRKSTAASDPYLIALVLLKNEQRCIPLRVLEMRPIAKLILDQRPRTLDSIANQVEAWIRRSTSAGIAREPFHLDPTIRTNAIQMLESLRGTAGRAAPTAPHVAA